VYYLAGEYGNRSPIAARCCKRKSRHFGGALGARLIYLRRERYDEALAGSARRWTSNPNMLGVEFNIRHIEQLRQEKRGKQI